ncbi:MAG: hypothetical protein JW940_29925 [Polyangiaceae bacterium]|nr:hypothetical protein [Polyangiaceae bacterium]
MPPSTALILNPHARRLHRDPELVARLERVAEGRAPMLVTETLADLDLACATMAGQPPDQVLVCGGDGTVMSAITALWRAFGPRPLPRLVLVPAGTVSTTARRFSGHADPLQLVDQALAGALAATSRQPTLEVTEPDAAARLGFTFGTGLVARFFERYDAATHRGRLRAAAIVARTLLGSLVGDAYARSVLEPVACTLRADELVLRARAFSLVVASVLKNVGLGMRVTYRAGEDPMRPHVVASALVPRRLGPQLWRVLLGRRLRGEGGFDGLVHELGLEFHEPTSYVLDGERFVASAVTVRAGPVVEIAVP